MNDFSETRIFFLIEIEPEHDEAIAQIRIDRGFSGRLSFCGRLQFSHPGQF